MAKKHFCQLIGICLDLYFQMTSKSHSFFQLFNIQTFLSVSLPKFQLPLYHPLNFSNTYCLVLMPGM